MPWKQPNPSLTNSSAYLEPRVSNVETSLADIAIDVKNPPAPLVAAKGDGITDDTAAIQAVINNYNNIYIPPGNYKISDTLYITETSIWESVNGTNRLFNGKHIKMTAKTRLLQSVNKTVLDIVGAGSTIENGILDVSMVGSGYTASALKLHSESATVNTCYNRFVDLKITQGNSVLKGKALELSASNDGYCYYNKFIGCHISWFYYGIYFTNNASMGGLNSNLFDIDINSSQQLMYLNGGGGNVFTGSYQATFQDSTNPNLACIYLNQSSCNQFYGFIFDVNSSGTMKYAYELNQTSYNVIGGFYHPSTIKIDNTLYNTDVLLNRSEATENTNLLLPFKGDISYGKSYQGDISALKEYYKRYYSISPINNTLATKNNLNSIVVTTSDCVAWAGNSIGDLGNLFNHNGTGIFKYVPNDATLGGTVNIDITLTNPKKVMTLGVLKNDTEAFLVTAKAFVMLNGGSTWTEIPDMFPLATSQNKSSGLFDVSSVLSASDLPNVKYIRFQFIIPTHTSNVVTNGKIASVNYLYVNYVGNNQAGSGYPWIGGDTFTGDINFDSTSHGVVIKDTANGHTYRLTVTNGVLGVTQVT